jgi:hypothetical protein
MVLGRRCDGKFGIGNQVLNGPRAKVTVLFAASTSTFGQVKWSAARDRCKLMLLFGHVVIFALAAGINFFTLASWPVSKHNA